MFRSIAEFEETAQPLSQAEQALIAACRKGEPCTIGKGTLPPEGKTDKALQIRASLLRILILGGTPDCGLHESGVDLHGAHITETLDLRFAKGRGQLALDSCRFDKKLQLEQTKLDQLSLQDSHFPGLFAQGAKIAGTVFLRRVVTTGTVDVNRVEIDGALTCEGACLYSAKGKALNAQRAKVAGSVFLSAFDVSGKATAFTAKGTVDLVGAEIGGQLACNGAMLDGADSYALNAQKVRILGGFLFRKVTSVTGVINLNAAHVTILTDDPQSWQRCQNGLILDGLTYDRIIGDTAPKTFAGRKDWLEKGSTYSGDFSPQPYTQLAKVFRAAGDMGEARKVLMERDRLLFEHAYRIDSMALKAALHGDQAMRADAGWIWLRQQGRRLWGSLSRRVVGFGHRPEFALFWALGFAFAGTVAYFIAYRMGLMVPNSDVVMVSGEWLQAVRDNRVAPNTLWNGDSVGASAHYETFFALIYAFDVFLPIVDLGQESAWAATTTTTAGWLLRVATFLYQIAGWVITSLGIAAVTGFVQRGGPD